MKKQLTSYIVGGIILVAVATAAVSMSVRRKLLPFQQMTGVFKCEGFGLPDKSYDRLMINPEMQVIGMAGERQMTVGRLAPRDEGAELEYSMEVVHAPSFNLDPFTAPRLRAYRDSLVFAARENEKDFAVECVRQPR